MLRSLFFFSTISIATLSSVAISACDPGADTPPEPSASPEGEPSASPEGEPSASPEAEPSASPEGEPSASPEGEPSASPEGEPSASPEGEPSASPEGEPDDFVSTLPCSIESYDASDALLSSTVYTFANNAIASILTTNESEFVEDNRTTYFYDAEGRVERVETDAGDDGTVESTSTYTYAGDIVASVLTTSTTGTESLTTYEWDGTLITRLSIDNGNDGSVDIVTDYTYDADGRMTRIETDNDNNGTTDSVTVMTYTTVGNVTTQRTDSGGDGSFEYESRTTVDEEGKTLRVEGESLISPTPAVTTTVYSYDAQDRISRIDTSTNSIPNGFSIYDYSCHN